MQSEGDKSANPQDGKDDKAASAAKLWGINCSRCLKGRPQVKCSLIGGHYWLVNSNSITIVV